MSPSQRDRSDGRGVVGLAAGVFGLTGFAVAQPLFGVLGDGATFFVAHGTTPKELLGFTALVVLLPPILVGAILAVAYGLVPKRWGVAVAAVMGLLLAAVVVPTVDRAVHLATPLYVVVAIAVAAGGALLYDRTQVVRTYLSATAFAPVLFAGLFLFASPASAIVSPSTAVGVGDAALDTDVVLLVFDEMPLAPLLDAEGGIDEVRFPNFARLAGTSTWYPNTSTVSRWTQQAIPSILSGTLPSEDLIPIASDYPRNLLRMLSLTHEVRAMETITFLCGPEECANDRPRSRRQMLKDASTVFLNGLLPDGLAERWLPATGDRWAGFGEEDDVAPQFADREDWDESANVRVTQDQGARVDELLANLADGDRPTFLFGHLLLPHLPLRFLPDGSVYQVRTRTPGVEGDGVTWTEDDTIIQTNRQRYLLQAKYVDTIIGRVLDELEQSGRLDDTMLVVTSDHGIVFRAGETRRGFPLVEDNAPELLPVPLFVHVPGQTTGAVDRLPRQITDVAPTIAEVLDVDLPDDWRFDGRPLSDPDPRSERDFVGMVDIDPPLELDALAAADVYHQWFGVGRAEHDVYAWGPGLELVGTPAADHQGGSAPDVTGVLESPDVRSYDPVGPLVPALVRYRLEGELLDGDWIAVALNGVVAGAAPVHEEEGEFVSDVMIDPALLRAGSNDVAAFVLRDGRLGAVTDASS